MALKRETPAAGGTACEGRVGSARQQIQLELSASAPAYQHASRVALLLSARLAMPLSVVAVHCALAGIGGGR